MAILYTLIIRMAGWFILPAALFSSKIKAWREGRKQFPTPVGNLKNPVWIHCASLGEFEQARPVIEAIRSQLQWPVLLSFFSPSGYLVRKDYPGAEQVIYLPLDTPENARKFLASFQPRLAIMVKYDLWFNYLKTCEARDIPLILISAQFPATYWLFKPWARWFRDILFRFDAIFVQDSASLQVLEDQGYHKVYLAGDTRIDRVLHLPAESRKLPALEEFTGAHPILVAGSTWPKDETILGSILPELIREGWKIILVPHDVGEQHLTSIMALLPRVNTNRLSRFEHGKPADVLVVDQIGLLSYLYRYATLVYIGGGFGAGIHNTLEPMAYGKPVLFGPKYRRFPEAVFLAESGAGTSITGPEDLLTVIHRFSSESVRLDAGAKIEQYLQNHRGATPTIIDYIRNTWNKSNLTS
ncbi:MAG: 3-deoxy-D-manno-octulosonic acid transferase [Saprospiraceae bacterium]|nr:3-deoxy-D-manno-octulosonic acid transferase [Saprospiraceae bacterium]MCB9320203.1 3-deoxy-D-manno-octulosonic acid transferase [Lewinellaceae bacterium]